MQLPLTTSSPETIIAQGTNTVVNGTQNTFQASDTITGSSSGTNTLKLVDTGTAAWTLPAATVSGVQTISLQNINGTAAIAGVKEVATITLNGMANATTFSVGDLVLTNATGAAVTGAQMATVLTGGAVANLTLSGGAGTSTRPTNYEVGTISGTNNTVAFVAQAAGATTDLAVGGTSQSGLNSVQILTFATNPGNIDNTLSVNVNGVTATSAAAGTANTAGLQNEISTLANAINQAAGSTIATYDGNLAIIVNAPRTTTISALTAAGTTNTTTLTTTFAPTVQTLVLGVTVPGATTAVTFRLNGVQVTTAALATNAVDALGAAYVAAINTAVGRTVASYVDGTDTLTINNGTFGGLAFTNVGSGNTEKTFGVTTASSGYIAPNTATQTVVQGVTAVASTTQLDTVDATKFVGATNFTSETSSGDVTYNGLTSAQSVTVNGGTGAVTAAFGATATTATINVSGAHQTGNLTLTSAGGTGLATVTLNSLGTTTAVASTTAALGANLFGAIALGGTTTALNINAANNLVTGTGITGFSGTTATITVSGTAGVVNLGTIENTTVKTVNASGLTAGGVTVVLNTNATMAFTGGAGVDTVTTGAVLTTGTVNGGGGSGDILVVGANVPHVNTAALAAKYTNFEILRVNGTMDASLISGISQVQLSGATNNISNLSSTQSVSARVNIGATTLAPASGTANTLNLTMGNNGTATAAANSGALTISGYQTLNMTVTPGATQAVSATGVERTTTIDSFTAANLTAINLTGTAAILSNAATTLATTINGSALTGNGATGTGAQGLTVAGSLVSGSSVVGSGLRDQFTLGTAAANTYDGGAGNDLFITSVTNLGTGGAADPTLIGGLGTDTLRISNATVTLTDANFKKVSGFEALNFADATDNISITGLTTNANAAFATAMTVTAGSTDTPMATARTFTFEGLAYANNVTLTLITNNAMLTNAGSIAITTGAGADTVTVTAAALTGAIGGAGNGTVVISTGSGVDTITVSTGTLVANTTQAVQIIAGTGADVIDVTSHVNNAGAAGVGNIMFTTAAGDSTTTAFDQITGFKMSDIGGTGARVSDALDFASVTIQGYTATAATGFTAAQLTVAVDGTTGVVTLAGTSFTAGLTLQQTIDAVQSIVTLTAGNTALFTYATAGVTSTYVFNNNSTADSVVQLVGISGSALITTNDVTTNNGIFIT